MTEVARQYRLGRTRRFVNALVRAQVRRGSGSKSTYLLTTTGARSGMERTTPVIAVDRASQRYLVAPYGAVGWVHNVRASGKATLSRGPLAETFAAEEVDADEAGPVLRQYLDQARVTAPYFDAKRNDPVEVFVAEAHRHPVFRLTEVAPPET